MHKSVTMAPFGLSVNCQKGLFLSVKIFHGIGALSLKMIYDSNIFPDTESDVLPCAVFIYG